ncbi:MAG: glycosyltransferase [Cyanobacteriota bacterium]|nr:glycosyltransferase [Cyanobacteriota bacterium]
MRVLIFTSSAGTAHDAAAEALVQWFARTDPMVEVTVESILENASAAGRCAVDFYNWIQRRAPWLHQLYWRFCELEDLTKPGTVLAGRAYIRAVLERVRPDLLISTYPHTNRGHFAFARRVLRRLGQPVRCVICCTELDGGFGFSRNWVSRQADRFWAITGEAAREARRRHTPTSRIATLGPLLYPAYHDAPPAPVELAGRPRLVLGTGGNGANNHLALLEQLLPLGDHIEVIALCGKRAAVRQQIEAWGNAHSQLPLQALGFQGPEAMVELYRSAWAMVTRPGARTATEALVVGCPLIFNVIGSTMPQEQLARRYFRDRGLETVIRRPVDLAAVVGGWLAESLRYQQLRQRMHLHRLRTDPQLVVEDLLHG